MFVPLTDEFFTVDKFKVPQFLVGAEKLGATYVLGTLRDRHVLLVITIMRSLYR